ncbi:MAG: leucyl/phenylalanyl-tRNA--protein transferase [Kiloniellales bacterium]
MRVNLANAEVTPELLLKAYSIGLFPMAECRDGPMLFWVEPKRRGVLPLDRFHLPRRLRRTLRQGRFRPTCDAAFRRVIEGCAEATPGRPNTWINHEILDLYCRLHQRGHAHSVECWQNGELAGGLYGVALGGAFFGESMFTRVRDASKVALVHLVARLRAGGFVLLDIQFNTRHLQGFGAVEIEREVYRRRLARALAVDARFPVELDGSVEDWLRGGPTP